jgi:hypothetical protein
MARALVTVTSTDRSRRRGGSCQAPVRKQEDGVGLSRALKSRALSLVRSSVPETPVSLAATKSGIEGAGRSRVNHQKRQHRCRVR